MIKATRLQTKAGIYTIICRMENGGFVAVVDLSTVHFADYQRAITATHVKKIQKDWNERAADMPKLSLRDGKLWCYDGQHTIHARLERGENKVWAIVFEGLTYTDEAKLFFIHNDVPKKMNGWVKFRADMNSGNAAKRRMLDIIHDFNLTVPGDPLVATAAHADVTSSRAVQEAFKRGGEPLLKLLCRIIGQAWRIDGKKTGPVQEAAKQIDLLRGLIHYLHANRESLDVKALIITLRRIGPEGVREIANQQKSKGRIDAAQIREALEKLTRPTFRLAA